MKFVYQREAKKKLKAVDQLIREAEERKARGEPSANEAELSKLKNEKREGGHKMLQAERKDFLYNRNRKREKRKLPQKILDASGGEL